MQRRDLSRNDTTLDQAVSRFPRQGGCRDRYSTLELESEQIWLRRAIEHPEIGADHFQPHARSNDRGEWLESSNNVGMEEHWQGINA